MEDKGGKDIKDSSKERAMRHGTKKASLKQERQDQKHNIRVWAFTGGRGGHHTAFASIN